MSTSPRVPGPTRAETRAARPEHRVTQLRERERVDLRGRAARHLQAQQAPPHVLFQPLAVQPGAELGGLLGATHVLGAHPGRGVLLRFVAGLHQHQPQPVPLEREPLLIVCQPQGALERARHPAGVEGQQLLLPHQRCEHLGRGAQPRGVERGAVGEVGAHSEELAEVGVLLVERLVELHFAGEHHAALEGNGLGVERLGGGGAHHQVAFFGVKLAGAQAALERAPHLGLGEQRARGQHQEAAVRPVQRARAQVGEVGGEHALLDLARGGAEQRGRGGVAFLHHRRAGLALMGDEHVHAEAQQRRGALLLGGEEEGVLSGQRGAQAGEVRERVGLGEVVLHRAQRALGDLQRHLLSLRRELSVEAATQLAQLAVRVLDQVGHLREGGLRAPGAARPGASRAGAAPRAPARRAPPPAGRGSGARRSAGAAAAAGAARGACALPRGSPARGRRRAGAAFPPAAPGSSRCTRSTAPATAAA